MSKAILKATLQRKALQRLIPASTTPLRPMYAAAVAPVGATALAGTKPVKGFAPYLLR